MTAALTLTLPPALAARAKVPTVLAVIDGDGMVDAYATAEDLAKGERLRCFSVDDWCVLDGLYAAARKLAMPDDAETVRDADERHTAAKGRGQFRAAHAANNRTGAYRPGRSMQ